MSDSDLQAIGVDNPTMTKRDYKLQVGDMNNRSSLEFMALKGKTLTQKK
ncbi:Outer membrane protein assembly factor BamC [Arsenophonus endosymbiont of Bemisia tabaci Q2]|nr:Outer membrane protein assembly factor BamC [Arsenophonus endosymbiont of Bemisia tabaci Q2]